MDETTSVVKRLAAEAGFARVGIAPAGPVPQADRLRTWLLRGYHADMAYMAVNLEKRLRPDFLVPGARSAICLAVGYAPPEGARPGQEAPPAAPSVHLVARYARGRDYHKVLKRRCRALMDRIREVEPSFQGRAFVDSAPVCERGQAASAGLGWIGRNGCLIVPRLGSFVVLCEIISSLPLVPDAPLPNGCGHCRACVDACPTGAIVEDSFIDARRCISYLTVEHRGRIDPQYWPRMGCRVFGCDACQEACPHNGDVPAGDAELLGHANPLGGGGCVVRVEGILPSRLAGILPADEPLGGAGLAEILAWTPEDWDAATRGSAIRRAGFEMLLRNAVLAAGNSWDASLLAPLRRLVETRADLDEPLRWAIGLLEAR